MNSHLGVKAGAVFVDGLSFLGCTSTPEDVLEPNGLLLEREGSVFKSPRPSILIAASFLYCRLVD